MVPKLFKRLVGRSASRPDDDTLDGRNPGLEHRGLAGHVGNPLPSAWVKMHVWRRDGGTCVQCGDQEAVWFDYIVPVWEGGRATERNIRLMCNRCRRDHVAWRRRKRWRA
jgi:HNH endonuclease